jgi:hypothetical protein
MTPLRPIRGCALVVALLCSTRLVAQTPAPAPPTRTTGGLSLGLSGMRSDDGRTVAADVMWVGDEMNDGIGVRFLRQALAPRSHGYAAMIVIGGPPTDSIQWFRFDFGMGYVGRQSAKSLKVYQRHGIGVQLGMTVAPWRFGIIRPELNGWAVAGTSAQFLGVSLGARLLDPRQRR